MSKQLLIPGNRFGASLEFSNPSWNASTGELEEFFVRYRAENIDASTRVYAYLHGPSLPNFFHELAENWKGWTGSKDWSSLEGELSLACTSDRTGHVTIDVEFRHFVSPGPWKVRGELEVDAGQLEAVSTAAKKFFSQA